MDRQMTFDERCAKWMGREYELRLGGILINTNDGWKRFQPETNTADAMTLLKFAAMKGIKMGVESVPDLKMYRAWVGDYTTGFLMDTICAAICAAVRELWEKEGE